LSAFQFEGQPQLDLGSRQASQITTNMPTVTTCDAASWMSVLLQQLQPPQPPLPPRLLLLLLPLPLLQQL
jgi:hypothetical protein